MRRRRGHHCDNGHDLRLPNATSKDRNGNDECRRCKAEAVARARLRARDPEHAPPLRCVRREKPTTTMEDEPPVPTHDVDAYLRRATLDESLPAYLKPKSKLMWREFPPDEPNGLRQR